VTSQGSFRTEQRANLTLSEWERGIAVPSADDPTTAMYLWFWEWNMFGALNPGRHTNGTFENSIRATNDGQSATILTEQGQHASRCTGRTARRR